MLAAGDGRRLGKVTSYADTPSGEEYKRGRPPAPARPPALRTHTTRPRPLGVGSSDGIANRVPGGLGDHGLPLWCKVATPVALPGTRPALSGLRHTAAHTAWCVRARSPFPPSQPPPPHSPTPTPRRSDPAGQHRALAYLKCRFDGQQVDLEGAAITAGGSKGRVIAPPFLSRAFAADAAPAGAGQADEGDAAAAAAAAAEEEAREAARRAEKLRQMQERLAAFQAAQQQQQQQ